MFLNPEIFGYELSWYPFFHWSGVFAAFAFGIIYYRKNVKSKLPLRQLLPLLIFLLPLALVGSRIAGMMEYYISTGELRNLSILWASPSKGQFRWCGTLLAFLIILPILVKQLKWSKEKTLELFDVMAISLCLLTAIAKQGCLFSGDGCYGIPTNLPWGMHFLHGSVPSILPVHPTPIYDGIFHLLLFGLLVFWNKRKSFSGQTSLLYLVVASIFYILLEVIRINPETSIGLTIPQITYILIVLGAASYYHMLYNVKKQKNLI